MKLDDATAMFENSELIKSLETEIKAMKDRLASKGVVRGKLKDAKANLEKDLTAVRGELKETKEHVDELESRPKSAEGTATLVDREAKVLYRSLVRIGGWSKDHPTIEAGNEDAHPIDELEALAILRYKFIGRAIDLSFRRHSAYLLSDFWVLAKEKLPMICSERLRHEWNL